MTDHGDNSNSNSEPVSSNNCKVRSNTASHLGYIADKVSIIIPNFNYGRFLHDAIRTAIDQTAPAYEIIVVDGWSTDGSLDSVHFAQKLGLPIRAINYVGLTPKTLHEPAPYSVGAARNAGIRNALGEYIICLDADDMLDRTYIERCLEQVNKRSEVGIVTTGMVRFGDFPSIASVPPRVINLASLLQSNDILCGSLFRQAAWQEVGGYREDPDCYEDWDLWIRIVRAGWKVATVPNALFHYRVHAGSVTRRRTPEQEQKMRDDIQSRYAQTAKGTDADLVNSADEPDEPDTTKLVAGTVELSFVDGVHVKINGTDESTYVIHFDGDMTTSYHAEVDAAHSHYPISPPAKYYVPWHITVEKDGVQVFSYQLSLTGRKVLICLASQSLGDTVAWSAYMSEFANKHKCELTVETHWPELFERTHKATVDGASVTFKKAGTGNIKDYFAVYLVGAWDGDSRRNRRDWRSVPLQQVATDALGLEPHELRPEIVRPAPSPDLRGPFSCGYIAISEFSAFQLKPAPVGSYGPGFVGKHWERGKWQEIVDWLKGAGYGVASVSKEPTQLLDILAYNSLPILDTIRNIQSASLFIGLSSGLAWVAWALGVPVVMIGGMTEKWVEMKEGCERVIDESVCHGCFNDLAVPVNRARQDWCPRGKRFECSKAITVEQVIEAVRKFLPDVPSMKKTEQKVEYKVQLPDPNSPEGEKLRRLQEIQEAILENMARKKRQAATKIAGPRPPHRVLMICPHLSTGGLPQYTLKCVEHLREAGADVLVVEWTYHGKEFVVQRKKIEALAKLHSFGFPHGYSAEDKKQLLSNCLSGFNPTIVHLQERPEYFLDPATASVLFSTSREYRIVETTHDSSVNPDGLQWLPDAFALVCQHHLDLFRKSERTKAVPCRLVKYELGKRNRAKYASVIHEHIDHINILNVGLWTPGKSQHEIVEIARLLPSYRFHFVGNQAPNFSHYWKPVIDAGLPPNCYVWGERDDVGRFYTSSDLLLFPSRSELAPLVIPEALSYSLPVLMRRLPIYGKEYDGKVMWMEEGEGKQGAEMVAEQIRQMFSPMTGPLLDAYEAAG